MAPLLDIQLLGPFRLVYQGEKITAFNASPRLQSLLAYLVLHGGIPQPRQHLALLFWPSSAADQARVNLRKLLYQLRRALPAYENFINEDAGFIYWHDEAACAIDAPALQRLLALSRQEPDNQTILREIARLYAGPLLPVVYDDWVAPLRRQLEETALQTLERLLEMIENQEDYTNGLTYAEQLLRLAPLEQRHYHRLMRFQALAGDRQGMAQTYQRCLANRHLFRPESDQATWESCAQLMAAEPALIAETTLLPANAATTPAEDAASPTVP